MYLTEVWVLLPLIVLVLACHALLAHRSIFMALAVCYATPMFLLTAGLALLRNPTANEVAMAALTANFGAVGVNLLCIGPAVALRLWLRHKRRSDLIKPL